MLVLLFINDEFDAKVLFFWDIHKFLNKKVQKKMRCA